MTEKQEAGETLSAEETAYFESGGATALPEEAKEEEAGAGKEQAIQQSEAEGQQEQPKPGERDDKGRFVPHGALHAEREEHKKTRSELEELKRFRAVMEDRWRMVEQAGQRQQQEQQPEIPDENSQPIETIAWLKQQLLAKNQQEQQSQAEWQERQRQENAARERYTYADQKYREVEQADPEVGDAYSFARESYRNELRALGVPEAQLPAREQMFIQSFVNNIIDRELDIAEFVKTIAKSRGWQPKPAQQQQEVTDKLKRIEGAQSQARSVGQAGGRSGSEELGLAELVAMPRAEFEAWYANEKNAARYNKLMGG